MDRDIQFVYGEDWLYLYIDGELVFEHHPGDLEPEYLLKLLGFTSKSSGVLPSFFEEPTVFARSASMERLDEARETINRHIDWGDPV